MGVEGEPRREKRAGYHLAASADIDTTRTKGDTDTETYQQKGGRFDQRLSDAEGRPGGAAEHGGIRDNGMCPKGHEKERTDYERDDDAGDGYDEPDTEFFPVTPGEVHIFA